MQEQDGDAEPAHHARRPMNAFLIFCKRHRSVVRDKYPNLENRSITKILGEWWANLDKEEKACYTGLAKQYKDAFFSANPDFKWYKLPAPPLRTLAPRPREPNEKTASPTNEFYHETEVEKTNNNSTKVDFNKKPREHVYEEPKSLSMFTPGKLADEAQMGGLSRLLDAKTDTTTANPYYSPTPIRFGAISNEYRSLNVAEKKLACREDNIRELQNALSETSKVFKEDFDENQARIYRHGVPSDIFTHQHVINQVVDKQFFKEDEYGYPRWSDDEKNMRSGRSCKGKRYQEFMAVGGLMANKRQRRERDKTPEESYNYNASCSWDASSLRSEDSAMADDKNQTTTEIPAETETKTESTEASELDNNINKTFKAADFDLDAKIAALPSLSLEKFQQKKRENKRRKKTVNLKPKLLASSHIVNSVPIYESRREMVENWREQVIGSQKRKPRKISITRFEISSLVPNMEPSESRKVSPEIKLATEAPCTIVQNMEICKQPPLGVDLLALATLAEVASNTSKMDAVSTITYTSKANDDHASTV